MLLGEKEAAGITKSLLGPVVEDDEDSDFNVGTELSLLLNWRALSFR